MEIISYAGTSAKIEKTPSDFNLTLPRLPKFRKKKAVRMLHEETKKEFSLTQRSPVRGVQAFFFSQTERQFTIAGLSKLFSTLMFLLLLLIVPFTVFNVLSFFENHTFNINIDMDSNYEFEALSSAMSRFAMYDIVSDNVDEDGNVLSEDGSLISSTNIGIGEAVTFTSYTVKSGDSISTISRKFGLSNISTLIAVNDISNVRTLRQGQKLKVPSTDGLIYKVHSGDSLNSISVKYHVSVEEILDANDLSSEALSKDMELFIPGAKMDALSLKKAMGELFVYPITASWRLTSKFGPRKDPFTGVASNHTGIDMACPTGTPIHAAMSGKVVQAGWSNIFGNYVIINHGNGYQTLYGHMSKIIAKKGQNVDQSTKIGLVGSTGYSTGPHLHFTVYKNGKLVDPLTLLKK